MEEHASRSGRTFSDSFAIDLAGKIMVAAILVLFLVIAFVLILQLYARWYLLRIDESTPISGSRRRAVQESAVATLRKGLEPAVLRSLPVLIFEPAEFKEGLECAVCLSELTQGEKARLLPTCNHGFHVDCIDMWFQSNSTCPLCRNPVATKSSNPTESHSAEDLESRGENLESGSSMESPIFPTNVLFWGDEMQVSSRGVCLEEGPTSSSSSSTHTRADGMVAIDIPCEPSTSSSPSVGGGCFADEETKSAVTTRLRTLKRLLSRERRVGNSPTTSADIEQVGRGQS